VAPQRRQQILDALFRCMARKSYAHVSVTEIAREARVARGAINFFFRSKGEILHALLDRSIAEYQDALRPILQGPAPPDKQLRAVLETLLAPGPALRQMTLVFLNYYALGPGNREVAAALRRFFHEYRRLFALILRRGIRQGCYGRDMEPDQAAAALVAAVEGLLIQWVVDEKSVDPTRAAAWLARLMEQPRPDPSGARPAARTSRGA
jgi:AcrR family transcriptional regulator